MAELQDVVDAINAMQSVLVANHSEQKAILNEILDALLNPPNSTDPTTSLFMNLLMETQTNKDVNNDGYIYGKDYVYSENVAPPIIASIIPSSKSVIIVNNEPEIIEDEITGVKSIKVPDELTSGLFEEEFNEFANEQDMNGDGLIYGEDYVYPEPEDKLAGLKKQNNQVMISDVTSTITSYIKNLAREARYRVDLNGDGLVYGVDYIYDVNLLDQNHPLKSILPKSESEMQDLYDEGGNAEPAGAIPLIVSGFKSHIIGSSFVHDIETSERSSSRSKTFAIDSPLVLKTSEVGPIDSEDYNTLKSYYDMKSQLEEDPNLDLSNHEEMIYGFDYIMSDTYAPTILKGLEPLKDDTVIVDAPEIEDKWKIMIKEYRDQYTDEPDELVYGLHYIYHSDYVPGILKNIPAINENTIIYKGEPDPDTGRPDPHLISLYRESFALIDLNNDGYVYGKDFIYHDDVAPDVLKGIEGRTSNTVIYGSYNEGDTSINKFYITLLLEAKTGVDLNNDGVIYGHDFKFVGSVPPELNYANDENAVSSYTYVEDKINRNILKLCKEYATGTDVNKDGKIYGVDYVFDSSIAPVELKHIPTSRNITKITDKNSPEYRFLRIISG